MQDSKKVRLGHIRHLGQLGHGYIGPYNHNILNTPEQRYKFTDLICCDCGKVLDKTHINSHMFHATETYLLLLEMACPSCRRCSSLVSAEEGMGDPYKSHLRGLELNDPQR